MVHPPQVEHHRWTSADAEKPAHGLTPLDEPTRAMLQQLRWRKPPHDPRRLWLAMLAAVFLHVFFGWVIWHQMRAAPVAPITPKEHDQAIEIRFIPPSLPAAAPAPPALPIPPPPPPPSPSPSPPPPPKAGAPRPRPVAKPEPVSKAAMTIRLPDTKPADVPAPKLFDKSGQALLPPPASSASAPPEADYVQRMPTDTDKIMQHTTPITYVPTRFDKDWHRTGTVDSALQKAVDATTVKKTINLPRGIHIHCAISLAMLAGGCGGDPPPPPSKKDDDERLSMAPSQPLAKDPHPSMPPSVDSCIAMYRAEKPLAYGCPIDTPNRSVDKEKADAIKAATDKAALDKKRAEALREAADKP